MSSVTKEFDIFFNREEKHEKDLSFNVGIGVVCLRSGACENTKGYVGDGWPDRRYHHP